MIVDQASWRWIFALNVPLVLATLALVLAAVPRTTRGNRRRVDFLGAALCARWARRNRVRAHRAASLRLEQPGDLRSAVRGLAALAAFLGYERRAAEPMLELALFSRRNFAVGNGETFAMYAGLAILFFFLDDLPAAGRRLQRARERPHDRSRDVGDVRAFAAFRRVLPTASARACSWGRDR